MRCRAGQPTAQSHGVLMGLTTHWARRRIRAETFVGLVQIARDQRYLDGDCFTVGDLMMTEGLS
jgi:hypothetical protein